MSGGKTESGANLMGTKAVQEKIPIYMGAQGPPPEDSQTVH